MSEFDDLFNDNNEENSDFDDLFGEGDQGDLNDLFDENENEEVEESGPVFKMPKGKLIFTILLGILNCILIVYLTNGLYTKYIRYPKGEEIVYEETGLYALRNYEEMVHDQVGVTNDDYLVKEVIYANSNPSILAFLNMAVNTVEYTVDEVVEKDIYGNDLIDRETNEVVKHESYLMDGEEVQTTYIDYSGIKFNTEKLTDLISQFQLVEDDVSYQDKLVDMFCTYLTEMEEIPTKTVTRVPGLARSGNTYIITADEDIYLDQELFSCPDLYKLEDEFTQQVGYLVYGQPLDVTEEWLEWNMQSTARKEASVEPVKYGKNSMPNTWCGVYYLQNEYYTLDETGNKQQVVISSNIGDGTLENPAGFDTPILTYALRLDENGEVNQYPIEVTLKEFGVSQDAIDWFQTKNPINRGYNLESDVQYCYAIFEVKNLSDKTLKIYDNASLADRSSNLTTRTGTISGLQNVVELEPDAVGTIETWSRSTEMWQKYLIWGANYNRIIEPVFFRVLAGNLEDTSKYKGVHIVTRGDQINEDETNPIDALESTMDELNQESNTSE